MDRNKLIILILIIVIMVLAAGIFSVSFHAKEDTKLAFLSNSTIYEGDSIEIKLSDLNNTPISNQTINITVDNNKSYSVVTDENGIGTFSINESEGNHTLNCTFYGNENYEGNNTSKNITVETEVIEAQSYSSSYSSSVESEPEYGSDDYVDKWDESQDGDGVWAYTHDQPVKTDDDGHRYKRMYDEGSGESYWYQMDQDVYE